MIYKKCVGNISRLFFNMSFLEGIEFFFNSTKKLRAMQTHCTCWVHNALDKCTHHVDIFMFSFWINHSRIFSFSLMFLPFSSLYDFDLDKKQSNGSCIESFFFLVRTVFSLLLHSLKSLGPTSYDTIGACWKNSSIWF